MENFIVTYFYPILTIVVSLIVAGFTNYFADRRSNLDREERERERAYNRQRDSAISQRKSVSHFIWEYQMLREANFAISQQVSRTESEENFVKGAFAERQHVAFGIANEYSSISAKFYALIWQLKLAVSNDKLLSQVEELHQAFNTYDVQRGQIFAMLSEASSESEIRLSPISWPDEAEKEFHKLMDMTRMVLLLPEQSAALSKKMA